MSARAIGVIFRKELLDISRDRRAMVFMIVMPIAIVPLIMFGMGKLMAFGVRKLHEEPGRVAILNERASPKIALAIRSQEHVVASAFAVPPELMAVQIEEAERQAKDLTPADIERGLKAARKLGVEPGKISELTVVEPPPADLAAAKRAIEEKELEAAVVIPDGFDAALAEERPAELTIVYDSSVQKSEVTQGKLQALLKRFERGVVLLRLPRHGIDKRLLEPIELHDETVATKEQEGRAMLALMLPYMLILMCLAGAVYPAIDVGAGEKERGTLETLLVSPAGRGDLVLGKLLVVFVTSLLAAALNIGSLAVSLGMGLMPDLGASIPISVDPVGAAVALVLMLPLAALFASALLAISIFAKSFKEAQTYFGPLNMIVILPAFFSFIPGVELNLPLSLVPIVNVSLAIKETLSGTYKWGCLGVIFASTIVLAAASVAFCARWFRREEVLFRS
ncbi:MAG TPA: ABC transporter permease [Planctomycetota bacterium]|nr:ABC transporter permease [Planctomycetota bacterium]